MSHIADFSLQADETLCTILYTIATEGGRGEGDNNGAEGTIVPQLADPPKRLKGFHGQCQTGP